jgi:imidazoleglycerol-phosphate dehydratase
MVCLDLSGRPHLEYGLSIQAPKVGQFDTELGRDFFQALARAGALTVHVRQLSGENAHHILESAFKSLGRALDQATRLDPRREDVPSTKGTL